MIRATTMAVAGLAAGILISGCAGARGGDTSCKDFLGFDEKGQNDAVAKLLKDEKGSDAANLEITGTRISVVAYCQTAGKQDSKIKEAPHL